MASNSHFKSQMGVWNLLLKFVLFLINFGIWVLGLLLLAVGIYVQFEKTFSDLQLDDVLTNPAIALIVAGVLLCIIGFCGCVGALREVFFLLIIYAVLLSIIVLIEVAIVTLFIVERDTLDNAVEKGLQFYITNYYDDVDLQNIIDSLQTTFNCCGVVEPSDWEENIYFNCSSIAFQRCSVPFSCCNPEEGSNVVINVQCGYRTLSLTEGRYLLNIHSEGCLTTFTSFITNNYYLVIGVAGGLILFQVINLCISLWLAIDINREKKLIKVLKQKEKQEKHMQREKDIEMRREEQFTRFHNLS